jgi:hypothetical protein
LEESKTPLAVAHAEIDSLNKDLLSAHRQELNLNKANDKVRTVNNRVDKFYPYFYAYYTY